MMGVPGGPEYEKWRDARRAEAERRRLESAMTRPIHMGEPVDELTELVARALVGEANRALDGHVRPITYEEVLADPRYAVIEGARAAIRVVHKAYGV